MSDDDLYSDGDYSVDSYSEDDLDTFDDDIHNSNSTNSAYHVSYTSISKEEIESRQDLLTERVSTLLGISKSKAATLLIHYKWHDDSLVERYMEDPQKVSDACGVYYKANHSGNYQFIMSAPSSFTCFICCDTPADRKGGQMQITGLECDHLYCVQCYRKLLSMKIKQDGEAAEIKCPGVNCGLMIDQTLVGKLVSANVFARYRALMDQVYVRDQDFLTWCPAPDCEYAVECKVRKAELDTIVPTVTCSCGKKFCFGCNIDDHRPTTCELAKKWIVKSNDDSETANWMAANTHECPNCEASIEKNGGCNHMICKKCKNEFCWVCMGRWSDHGNSYFNCSRYDPMETQKFSTNQAKARDKLERYLHYNNRYTNHLESLKLDHQTLVTVQQKMSAMQEESGMSWIEVQFLNQAYEALKASRPALAWSYAFAFYLKPCNNTQIFEDIQKDLEMSVESLSELFEKPPSVLAQSKIALLDKISYVDHRRTILMDYALKGLCEGIWEYLGEDALN